MGVDNINSVGPAKEMSDVFGPEALSYYEGAMRMEGATDTTFLDWLKAEPRTWQAALDKFYSTEVPEEIPGATLRHLSVAALRDNAYEVFMHGMTNRMKQDGLLNVPNEMAEEVIESWRR